MTSLYLHNFRTLQFLWTLLAKSIVLAITEAIFNISWPVNIRFYHYNKNLKEAKVRNKQVIYQLHVKCLVIWCSFYNTHERTSSSSQTCDFKNEHYTFLLFAWSWSFSPHWILWSHKINFCFPFPVGFVNLNFGQIVLILWNVTSHQVQV